MKRTLVLSMLCCLSLLSFSGYAQMGMMEEKGMMGGSGMMNVSMQRHHFVMR